MWYRTTVDVPEAYLKNHAAFFTIAGASFKFGLIVNGKSAGESCQAALPKEFNVTNLLKPEGNEIAFAITTREGIVDPVKQEYLASSCGKSFGFFGPIRLEFRPWVFIDDVFVKTSVAAKGVECEITLRNCSEDAVTVTPLVRITSEQDPFHVFTEIDGAPVDIPAHQEVVAKLKKDWIAPELWNADCHYLYVANVTLRKDGEALDSYRQTFDFREITTQGKDLLLNGKRIVLIRVSGLMGDGDTQGVNFISWKKTPSLNAGRMHLGGNPRWFVEHEGTRTGTYMIPESSFTFFSPGANDFNMAGVEEYFKGWTRLFRNQPYVIMYSLDNETIWAGTSPTFMAIADQVIGFMRKYAPNALLQADGDNSWGGRLDINNIHYPEGTGGTLRLKYPNTGFAIPNDFWWLTKGGAENGAWRTNPFKWDRPLVIGEFYFHGGHANMGDDYFRCGRISGRPKLGLKNHGMPPKFCLSGQNEREGMP